MSGQGNTIQGPGSLRDAGRALIAAAEAYRSEARYAGIVGSVIWFQGENNELVVFTRGEYRRDLLRNVDDVAGPTIAFGGGGDE